MSRGLDRPVEASRNFDQTMNLDDAAQKEKYIESLRLAALRAVNASDALEGVALIPSPRPDRPIARLPTRGVREIRRARGSAQLTAERHHAYQPAA